MFLPLGYWEDYHLFKKWPSCLIVILADRGARFLDKTIFSAKRFNLFLMTVDGDFWRFFQLLFWPWREFQNWYWCVLIGSHRHEKSAWFRDGKSGAPLFFKGDFQIRIIKNYGRHAYNMKVFMVIITVKLNWVSLSNL